LSGTVLQAQRTGDTIQFHADIKADVNDPATVAKRPVSRRSPASDHVQRGSITYTLECVTTRIPFAEQLTAEDQLGLDLETELIAYFERNRDDFFTVSSPTVGVVPVAAIESIKRSYDNKERVLWTIAIVEIRLSSLERINLPPIRRKPKLQPGGAPLPAYLFAPEPPIRDELSVILDGLVRPARGSSEAAALDAENRRVQAGLARFSLSSPASAAHPDNASTVNGRAVRNAFQPAGPRWNPDPSSPDNARFLLVPRQ
jgi:hypothetical protein